MKRFVRFLKDWTLPVSMSLGALVYLLFAYTPALEDAAVFFDPVFELILPWFMFLVLFVTFCKVDFHKMRPVTWHAWNILLQLVLVAIIVAFILYYHLEGNDLILMESALTCVIAPCATAAAVVTSKLGGNLESITTYTFLSNFITALLVPLCFPMVDPDVTMTFWQSFVQILYKVCMVLVMPMVLAYIVKHFMHNLHRRIVSVRDLSYYLWGCSLTIVTGTTVKHICHAQTSVWFLFMIAVLALLFCLVQFALGRWVGSHYGTTIDTGQALGQKNTAFAIWIAYTYLTPLSSVGPGCYILWQNIINSLELWEKRKKGELQGS
jgi:BASS family bile acid:Na+ symporter